MRHVYLPKKATLLREVKSVFLLILIVSVSIVMNPVADAQVGDETDANETDYLPIKWALIVLGGFDYDSRFSTGSPIQKVEHWVQSRGVPYDVVHESNLASPCDTPPAGKFPLQYANGTIRYGVVMIFLNKVYPIDSSNVDFTLIYWAVANGTNAVVFGYAVRYVPSLLNIASGDVTHLDAWGTKSVDYSVLRTFSDGIVEYVRGTVESLQASDSYVGHTKVNNIAQKTLWYNYTLSGVETYVGMMNYTYGSGNVFWNEHEPDQDRSYGGPFDEDVFGTSWETYNHKFLAHSINFMFNQVQEINVGLQGYKKWKGAVVYRLDQDGHDPVDKQNESALQAGWYYDVVICALGYVGSEWVSLTNGLPPSYTGSPSTTVKYGTASFVTSFQPLVQVVRKFIVYNSTLGGTWDRMKVDYDNNLNFGDDNAYGYWENQTAPGIAATYYWAYINDMMSPSEVTFGYWRLMRDRRTDYSWWKQQGQAGYLAFGLHSFQHAIAGTDEGRDTYYYWNGSAWTHNQTWIEQKLAEAMQEMAYNFGSTGYGYESTQVALSGAGNYYPDETRLAWNDLAFGELALAGRGETGGFFLRSDGKPELACAGGQVDLSLPVNFDSVKDAVQTLFPVIGTYNHAWGAWNLSFDVLPEHTAYTDMLRFDHATNILAWWLDARYMWRNTANAYYRNDKIILEYKANSTFEDFVWKFPIEYKGKYFNSFSDNCSAGRIVHLDGKYVYVEFSQGQGAQKLEVTYGANPHLYKTSNPVQNMTQTYTMKNLTLQLWNNSGSANVNVNCTELGQPSSIRINGNPTSFNYNSTTRICSFNVTFGSLQTVNVFWGAPHVDVTTRPYNQEGILYVVNVTVFDGSVMIASGITNMSGMVTLTNLPYGNLALVAYAKSDYSQVIGSVTVFISSEKQSIDLICSQNYAEPSINWQIIVAHNHSK